MVRITNELFCKDLVKMFVSVRLNTNHKLFIVNIFIFLIFITVCCFKETESGKCLSGVNNFGLAGPVLFAVSTFVDLSPFRQNWFQKQTKHPSRTCHLQPEQHAQLVTAASGYLLPVKPGTAS